ncbi:hypothetical protein ACP70R_035078 [Stipagrostis hirtigluma subsp. patula]
MQSMEAGKSAGRRLKDRLARLLRPANSLLRAPCSSSSSTSTAFTATAAAATNTISTSSSSTATTAANYTAGALKLPRSEPFSTASGRLRQPPLVRGSKAQAPQQQRKEVCCSSGHCSRRRFKNIVVDKGVVRTLSSNPYGFTTSDSDDDGEQTDGFGDGDDDTEMFFSSRSLMSSDSSGFYTSKKLHPPKTKSHQTRRRRRRRRAGSCVEACGGASEPGFRPLVVTTAAAAVAEEVRKGLAVVKRSRDPYGDFRESMLETIVGRQVFGAAELERMLRSYLSLNAPRLHPVILQAFSDIWVVLHGG